MLMVNVDGQYHDQVNVYDKWSMSMIKVRAQCRWPILMINVNGQRR